MNLLIIFCAVIFICFGLIVFRGSPYIPTHSKDARLALTKLYPIKKSDVLVDVGSGDGRILRLAAKLGAKKALGYELNPIMALISKYLSRRYKNVETKMTDFWFEKLPDGTTVIYIFFASRDIKKFIKKMKQESSRLGHEIFVISYGAKLEGIEVAKHVSPYLLYKIKG